ncbi:MAG TPA: hypothetical protein VFW94_07825 [Candidatus Acidoferrales bacterium]|nr:hypothetical protein [Candidatus Acidoferrales bacterium]
MNIVSLITCKNSGLSYVGITKNGRLDDPANFSPLRYGFGPRFIEALKHHGPDAFTVRILGHGYENRSKLCYAQRGFIRQYSTLWPHGYNVFPGHESYMELDGEWSKAKGLAVVQSTIWYPALVAAANKRKRSAGWREALKRRSKNMVWRRNLSITRMPYLHDRWHVKRGLVPDGTTVEDCFFCKAIHAHKALAKYRIKERPPAKISAKLQEKAARTIHRIAPFELSVTLEQDREEMLRRMSEMFGNRQS